MTKSNIACNENYSPTHSPYSFQLWLTDGNDSYTAPVSTKDMLATTINLRLDPNPAQDSAELSFDLLEKIKLKAILLNSNGQFVKELLDNTYNAGAHRETIHLANLPAGTYFINLESKGQTSTTRVIKIE